MLSRQTLSFLAIATLFAAAMTTTACAPLKIPENFETVENGRAYQAQYRPASLREAYEEAGFKASTDLNAERCVEADLYARQTPWSRTPMDWTAAAAEVPAFLRQESLSLGDLLRIRVGEDEMLSGLFEISRDGMLKLPHMADVAAHGRAVTALEGDIRRELVAAGLYRSAPQVSVRLADYAPASVHVSGAVFRPGLAGLGALRSADQDGLRQEVVGASTETRSLTAALRAAGGVRPDADLAKVSLTRQGVTTILDLRPVLKGYSFSDVLLLAGDQIDVPSKTCFQEALMVPGPVTPPGVKLFLSNLTKPADANALSAIGKDAREMPYGTRFSQAVFGMNCVGGAKLTNADRNALLLSRNPTTGQSIVIERSIEDLLRRADRDQYDPFLLPGDSITCYDSAVTNATELLKAIGIGMGTALLFAL